MIDYPGPEKFKSQQKPHNFQSGEPPKRRKLHRHRGVYKNTQSVKYANVTIPPKGPPAYFRRVSCGYAE